MLYGLAVEASLPRRATMVKYLSDGVVVRPHEQIQAQRSPAPLVTASTGHGLCLSRVRFDDSTQGANVLV